MLLLVLTQALILNNMHLFGLVTPFLYTYLLLKFNADMSRYALLFWGFFIGLFVDIFSNTLGINAAATTLLAFLRPLLLRIFTPRDSSDDFTPGILSMGTWSFIYYVGIATLLHQTALILIEAFSFAHLGILLLKITAGTLLTTICFYAIDRIKKK